MRVTISGIKGEDGKEARGCTECDNLWPCPTVVLILAYEEEIDKLDEFRSTLEFVSSTPRAAWAVWYTWYNAMRSQFRTVKDDKCDWHKLSNPDRFLDSIIARKVVAYLSTLAYEIVEMNRAGKDISDKIKAP
jgi:hypothetical protein